MVSGAKKRKLTKKKKEHQSKNPSSVSSTQFQGDYERGKDDQEIGGNEENNEVIQVANRLKIDNESNEKGVKIEHGVSNGIENSPSRAHSASVIDSVKEGDSSQCTLLEYLYQFAPEGYSLAEIQAAEFIFVFSEKADVSLSSPGDKTSYDSVSEENTERGLEVTIKVPKTFVDSNRKGEGPMIQFNGNTFAVLETKGYLYSESGGMLEQMVCVSSENNNKLEQKEFISSEINDTLKQKECVTSESGDTSEQNDCVSPENGDKFEQEECLSSETDDRLEQKECVSSKGDDQLEQKEFISSERDDKLEEEECMLSERDDTLEQKECASSKSDDQLEQKDFISERDDKLEEEECISSERDDTLEQKESVSSESDKRLEQKECVLSERDDRLEQKEWVSSGSGDALEEQDCVSSESDDKLEEKESISSEIDNRLDEKECVSSESDDRLTISYHLLIDNRLEHDEDRFNQASLHPVHATSWKSCCGLFELFGNSGR